MDLGNVLKQLPSLGKQIAVAAGLIALPCSLQPESFTVAVPKAMHSVVQPDRSVAKQDWRTIRLRRYLASLHCPVSEMADDFVHAADENGLDWRLLPSISVIESGGGKAYRNNNIFGWANGDHFFPTLRSGIHEVAFMLGKSSLYRNRDVEAKLHLYNPDQAYAGNVITVMNHISSVELRPAS